MCLCITGQSMSCSFYSLLMRWVLRECLDVYKLLGEAYVSVKASVFHVYQVEKKKKKSKLWTLMTVDPYKSIAMKIFFTSLQRKTSIMNWIIKLGREKINYFFYIDRDFCSLRPACRHCRNLRQLPLPSALSNVPTLLVLVMVTAFVAVEWELRCELMTIMTLPRACFLSQACSYFSPLARSHMLLLPLLPLL